MWAWPKRAIDGSRLEDKSPPASIPVNSAEPKRSHWWNEPKTRSMPLRASGMPCFRRNGLRRTRTKSSVALRRTSFRGLELDRYATLLPRRFSPRYDGSLRAALMRQHAGRCRIVAAYFATPLQPGERNGTRRAILLALSHRGPWSIYQRSLSPRRWVH